MSTVSDDKRLEEVLAVLKHIESDLRVNAEEHHEEHEYLRRLINEHKAKTEMWSAIRTRVISGALWSVLIAVVSAVILQSKDWVGL